MDFIPSTPVLISFTLAGILLNLTPGPDMTLQVNKALNEGRAAAFATLAGTVSGGLLHLLLAAIGISALIAASPTAFTVIKYAGAFYLAWLAFQMIRQGSSFKVNKSEFPQHTMLQNWRSGLLINLLNPKIVIFFLTFLPQFISASDPAATEKLIFLGAYFNAVSIPVAVFYILAADRLANVLQQNRRIMRLMDYLFATVFGAFAVKILLVRNAG